MPNTVKNSIVSKDVRQKLKCKALYLSGFYTTDQILKEVGIKRGVFYKWMREEGWVDERRKYQQELAKEVYGKLKKHLAEMYNEVDGVMEYLLNKVVTDVNRLIKAGESIPDLETGINLALRILTMKTGMIQFLQGSIGGDLPSLDPTALVLPSSTSAEQRRKALVGKIEDEMLEEMGIKGLPVEGEELGPGVTVKPPAKVVYEIPLDNSDDIEFDGDKKDEEI